MKEIDFLIDGRGLYNEELINEIMEERGVEDPERFLAPTESDLLPLEDLKNIDIAYEIVSDAVLNNKKIGILWDVDTDGACSGAIITRYLKKLGAEPDYFINHGKIHGVSREEHYYTNLYQYSVLIIVDSLNNTVGEYKEISDAGTNIVVLDHHNIGRDQNYSDYVTLVSSQDGYGNSNLSGAGVTWKFCKYYDSKNGTEFASDLVDLAAVGIVADVMDMSVPENRWIVTFGFKNLKNPAVKKILGFYEFNSTAISFSIAPLINAANRFNRNELAVAALMTDDNKALLKSIKELKKCKELQDEEVEALLPNALKQCDGQSGNQFLFVVIDSKHGLNGLLAIKIATIYDKPTFVVKDLGDYYSGSLRTPDDYDLAKAVNESGLATADGHEQAAGFKLSKDKYAEFCSYMNGKLQDRTINTNVISDARLDVEDFTFSLADKVAEIDRCTGKNFKPITFSVDNVNDYLASTMKDGKHLVIKVNDSFEIIKWNSPYDFNVFAYGSLFGNNINVIGTMQSGYIGKSNAVRIIADKIWIEEK